MKKYIIDEVTLRSLLSDQLELLMLESAGVDNWQWYGEHRHMYYEVRDLDVEVAFDAEIDTDLAKFELLEDK